MKIVGIVGWKNSGKTTLVERLIPIFKKRGYSVSTVKHAHHSFDIDHQGKDSYRHRLAGASEVMVVSSARWALVHERGDSAGDELGSIIARMAPTDLLLVEGYKDFAHPKIEVSRGLATLRLIAETDSTVIAVASDFEDMCAPCPVLPLNKPEIIADFVLERIGL